MYITIKALQKHLLKCKCCHEWTLITLATFTVQCVGSALVVCVDEVNKLIAR